MKTTKTTMHNTTDDLLAFCAGAVASVFAFFLKIDWHLLMHEGGKLFEAFLIGALGGAGGLLGKKWVNNIFKNKKPVK